MHSHIILIPLQISLSFLVNDLFSECLDFSHHKICFNKGPFSGLQTTFTEGVNIMSEQNKFLRINDTFLQKKIRKDKKTYQKNNDNNYQTFIQKNSPWHLSRLTSLDINNTQYKYQMTGENLTIYILDTIIDQKHSQFENRVKNVKDFLNIDYNTQKNYSFPYHGTHCAGLIVSKAYGVLKKAQIKALRVIDDNGYVLYEDVIRALHWIYKNHQNKKDRILVSMSFGGTSSKILSQLLDHLYVSNFLIPVLAAGNDNQDACFSTPGTKNIPIVASSNFYNSFSDFSNYGSCVSIIAPGENIESTCPYNTSCWMSGTSMSAPQVVGAIGYYWNLYPHYNTTQIWSLVKKQSLKNKITETPKNTKNRFIHIRTSYHIDTLLYR